MNVIDFFKKIYRAVYYRNIQYQWEKGPEKEMINFLTEFYNLKHEWKITPKEIKMMCKLGKRLVAEIWNLMEPRTEEEIRKYYQKDPFSIFELAYFHAHPLQKKFRQKVVNLVNYGKVLDYGGGIGDLSLKLAQKGLDVTYVDVAGINMEFAKFLFKKKNINVEVLDAEKDKEKIWSKKYDFIICIEVIEHVTRPEELLENIANSLNKKGTLIITGFNYPGPEPHQPMHRKIEFDIVKKLSYYGIEKTEDDRFWVKK